MKFSPFNNVVKLCLQGMNMEEAGKPEAACTLFLQGWNEATNDFEKFLAAHYVARHQKTAAEKLHWLETTLQFALKVDDDAVKSAFPSLYWDMAKCYEDLNNHNKAKEYSDLAISSKYSVSDKVHFITGRKQICRLVIC